jgi:hypothetical protein
MKILQGQKVRHRTGRRSLKFLADMLLDSASHYNSEGQSVVFLECTNNRPNELRHQIFVIALVESVNDNDCTLGPRQTGKDGVSHRQHRFNDQLSELMLEGLSENAWVTEDDIMNQGFNSGDRKGELIGERRNEASDDASVPRPSKKKETPKESALGSITASDSLRYR